MLQCTTEPVFLAKAHIPCYPIEGASDVFFAFLVAPQGNGIFEFPKFSLGTCFSARRSCFFMNTSRYIQHGYVGRS